jgi:hypothetical protein
VFCLDFSASLAIEALRLLCLRRAYPFYFQLQTSMLIHLSIPLRVVFLYWMKLGDSSAPLAITQKSLRIFWQKPSMVSSSYTVKRNISPPIILRFTCTIGLAPWDLALISSFRHSTIRHSCDQVSRHSHTRSSKLRYRAFLH